MVPAISGEIGLVIQAIRVRAENTRPCTSGATFDCQIAWFEPLISGTKSAEIAFVAIQNGTQVPKPIRAKKKLDTIQPASTPWTLRLNPPQALIATPPTTRPMAPAD